MGKRYIVPDGFTIKPIPLELLEEAANLWCFCFGLGTLTQESELEFAQNALSDLIGCFDKDDRLCATIGVIDFDTFFCGEWIKCAGISSVATHPNYRGMGIIPAMLKHCLAKQFDNAIPLAALCPFSYPYYEKLGWSITNFQYKIEISTKYLNTAVANRQPGYKRISLTDFDLLMPIHEKWISKFNLGLRRNHYRWHRQLTSGISKLQLLLHDNGYMIWDLQASSSGTLIVSEWAYLNEEAFLDGLALFGLMDTQVSAAQWIDSTLDSISRIGVSEPKPNYSVLPGMMTRVVNYDALKKVLPEEFKSLTLSDPLGISGNSENGITPGALIQKASGFWSDTSSKYRSFSIEKY